MDRCHRIGQTRPVLVFRLATAHSVEGKMLRRAADKMALERLVIKKGAFKDIHSSEVCGGEEGGEGGGSPGRREGDMRRLDVMRTFTASREAEPRCRSCSLNPNRCHCPYANCYNRH